LKMKTIGNCQDDQYMVDQLASEHKELALVELFLPF
jgi:hypothetical protein